MLCAFPLRGHIVDFPAILLPNISSQYSNTLLCSLFSGILMTILLTKFAQYQLPCIISSFLCVIIERIVWTVCLGLLYITTSYQLGLLVAKRQLYSSPLTVLGIPSALEHPPSALPSCLRFNDILQCPRYPPGITWTRLGRPPSPVALDPNQDFIGMSGFQTSCGMLASQPWSRYTGFEGRPSLTLRLLLMRVTLVLSLFRIH